MSNDAEIQMAVIMKGLPGVRHVLSTGLPLMSERTANIKSMQYENGQLRKHMEDVNVVADARLAVIDSQREEIAQLKAALKKAEDELVLREMQMREIAVAAQQFVDRMNGEVKAAQRDSRSAQEAMHRMWNERLSGGKHE